MNNDYNGKIIEEYSALEGSSMTYHIPKKSKHINIFWINQIYFEYFT